MIYHVRCNGGSAGEIWLDWTCIPGMSCNASECRRWTWWARTMYGGGLGLWWGNNSCGKIHVWVTSYDHTWNTLLVLMNGGWLWFCLICPYCLRWICWWCSVDGGDLCSAPLWRGVRRPGGAHRWRRHWCTQVVQTFWWLTAVTQTDHFPQRSLTLPFLHNNSLFSHPTTRPNLSQSHSQITILTFGFFVKSLWSVLRMHTLYPVVDRKAKNIFKKANNIFQSGWQLWCIGWGSIDFTDREDIWKQGSTHIMRGT